MNSNFFANLESSTRIDGIEVFPKKETESQNWTKTCFSIFMVVSV